MTRRRNALNVVSHLMDLQTACLLLNEGKLANTAKQRFCWRLVVMDVLANHQMRLLLSQNWTVLYSEYLNWRTGPPDSLSSFEWRKISKHFLAEILSTSRLDGCSGEPPALTLLLSQNWTRKILTHGCVRITCTLCTGTQTRWGSCYKFSDRCLQKPASQSAMLVILKDHLGHSCWIHILSSGRFRAVWFGLM